MQEVACPTVQCCSSAHEKAFRPGTAAPPSYPIYSFGTALLSHTYSRLGSAYRKLILCAAFCPSLRGRVNFRVFGGAENSGACGDSKIILQSLSTAIAHRPSSSRVSVDSMSLTGRSLGDVFRECAKWVASRENGRMSSGSCIGSSYSEALARCLAADSELHLRFRPCVPPRNQPVEPEKTKRFPKGARRICTRFYVRSKHLKSDHNITITVPINT